MQGMQQLTELAKEFSHCSHRKADVEAEARTAKLAASDLIKVEEMGGADKAGLEVAQQGIDPKELQQVVGVLQPEWSTWLAVARWH